MSKEKVSINYQEKYKKGVVVDKNEILRLISENINEITIEMRERTAYSDKTEEIIISVRY